MLRWVGCFFLILEVRCLATRNSVFVEMGLCMQSKIHGVKAAKQWAGVTGLFVSLWLVQQFLLTEKDLPV